MQHKHCVMKNLWHVFYKETPRDVFQDSLNLQLNIFNDDLRPHGRKRSGTPSVKQDDY